MKYHILKKENIKTSSWAGGETHEIAIYPFSSLYKDRDFIFRISFAQCLIDSSDFTSLPDYERKLSLIDGNVTLKLLDRNEEKELSPYEIFSFDGGEKIKSFGKCVDFNLMTRKGISEGELIPFKEGTGKMQLKEREFLCVFVSDGSLSLQGEENLTISSMEGVLLEGAGEVTLNLSGKGFLAKVTLK